MKNKPKNVNTPVIVILNLLAALFVAYGIYIAYDAVNYVRTYDANDAVSTTNMLQYVVDASASYFGFAIVIFAAAAIMSSLNKVQRNLYKASTMKGYSGESLPEDDAYFANPAAMADAADAESGEPEAVELHETAEPAALQEEPEPAAASGESEPTVVSEEPEPAIAFAEPEPTAASGEPEPAIAFAEPEPAEVFEQPEPAMLYEKPESVDTVDTFEPSKPSGVSEQSEPAAENAADSDFPSEAVATDAAVSPPLAEELSAQFLAEPEEPKRTPEPVPIPEEILQSKRKRGLRYETIAMEPETPPQEYPKDLSNTIRLKKEDRDAISSAFIRDILENKE